MNVFHTVLLGKWFSFYFVVPGTTKRWRNISFPTGNYKVTIITLCHHASKIWTCLLSEGIYKVWKAMHCVSEWENWKFKVKSICVGSGVFKMRFSGSRITAHWILQDSSDAGTDYTQHFYKADHNTSWAGIKKASGIIWGRWESSSLWEHSTVNALLYMPNPPQFMTWLQITAI